MSRNAMRTRLAGLRWVEKPGAWGLTPPVAGPEPISSNPHRSGEGVRPPAKGGASDPANLCFSTGCYAPDVDGTRAEGYKSKRQVTLELDRRAQAQAQAAPFVDRETKSHWGIEGRAQSGPLKGRTLRWVDSVQCRWFAWSAEYPDTRLHAGADAAARQDDDTAK